MTSQPTSTPPAAVAPPADEVFIGDGEMARLMRAHDWSASALGPVQAWPHALKVALRLLLTSRFEMWLGWGPDIAFFYNDAYRPTLGDKHPHALAMPTRQLWSEIWPEIEPRLTRVYQHGESTWDRALRLVLHRHGYPEETFHTFSYSPLIGDSGKVEGVFCAVSEETDRVISERRLATLRDLATGLSTAKSRAEVLRSVETQLAASEVDLPFFAGYLFDQPAGADDTPVAHRVCGSGLPPLHGAAPPQLPWPAELQAEGPLSADWPLQAVWRGAPARLLELHECLSPALLQALPTGPFGQAPTQAVVAPLIGRGTDRPLGALVVGLNPFRRCDEDYLAFLRLVAGQIAASLASADAFEAEQARVAEERDRLQRMFQQAPSFMCLLAGPEHRFVLVNDAYASLVGHRELLGLTVREALPEVRGQGFFELLDEVYSTRRPYAGRNVPVHLLREPGGVPEERYVHLIYQPLLDDEGQATGIFVDGYDVTHQRRAEEALQQLNDSLEQRVQARTAELALAMDQLRRESAEREAAQEALRHAQRMESLGALTGGVAHDFNNLLQVVSGNLQLLSRYVGSDARAQERVQKALAGVARGAKLASQLLAFGRRQPLEPKVVNLGRLMREMDDMLRRALGEEIALETVVSGGLWNTFIDPGQVENAVLNLAINARDAMGGAGRLTLEAGNAMLDDDYARMHPEVQPGHYVMLAVTDTGSGIAPELLDRVFEPFFSTKPEGKGTGLGLSMVYGFVKQSGGHVKLYSEVGEGTTVRLYLPRAHAGEDLPTGPADTESQGGHETVLVVEDDDEVRDTVVSLLTELGYRVLKARDAASALSVIDSGTAIDLLFTDVVMPGPLRSPELARRARERLPGIAVLFTSGYTENAIVHNGRLDVGVDLLSKPYTAEALARKVRQVLGRPR
ncbi:ATP-binding protein [uncultured Aquincola sp.]|uniref:hybrid sensor histidine kinase/response regulator n=1 Tax=uncultured Aquincola sp. TaxID=886556 RepID=UPI0032B227E6